MLGASADYLVWFSSLKIKCGTLYSIINAYIIALYRVVEVGVWLCLHRSVFLVHQSRQ